ncbi:MAG: hypothetical protein IJS48_02810 [Prevotella sp.]|nr:hypothetical protein [Prevotella sp.]
MTIIVIALSAMLLPTACSNEDDFVNNTENTIKKGYELPVTINVTREDATTTRATYNGTTKKLEFSTGDKLYVVGIGSPVQAGTFAGTLTWVSGGTFSGTIYTENEYFGTADDLLAAASEYGDLIAQLLPAGYEDHDYFVLTNPETSTAWVSRNFSKAFALTKATAVEQFSEECAYTYDQGLALSPRNAILNFTITGLIANTDVTVSFSDGNPARGETVTTDASGNATFAVGVEGNTQSKNINLTVDGNAVALNLGNGGGSNKTLTAGKIYNITRSAVSAGALAGKFTINAGGTKVYFSQGNLRYTSDAWSFFDNQWDYYTTYSAGSLDKFGWSTSATTYGMITSTTGDYSGDFVDWGATIGSGWRTLTSDEWTYLFKTRSASTVNSTQNARYAKAYLFGSKHGVILFPDSYTHPDGVAAPTGINATNSTSWNANKYSAADWAKMEAAGCVFLPAAGNRNEASVNNAGSYGFYWSSSPYATDVSKAYSMYFVSGDLYPAKDHYRYYGFSVRLVYPVE